MVTTEAANPTVKYRHSIQDCLLFLLEKKVLPVWLDWCELRRFDGQPAGRRWTETNTGDTVPTHMLEIVARDSAQQWFESQGYRVTQWREFEANGQSTCAVRICGNGRETETGGLTKLHALCDAVDAISNLND